MSIPKNVANKVLSNLDYAANRLEGLVRSGKADPRVASLVREIDSFADRFQVAAFGMSNLRSHQAKVLKHDKDEPYMSTFENPNKVLKDDPVDPEEFMHKTPASFNSGPIDNFDADRSSTVSDRKEYNVRDLNPMADGTVRQPSWAHGSAGKSTRQGSTAGKQWAEDRVARRASGTKEWAD